jgi:serine/threonine protein kinase
MEKINNISINEAKATGLSNFKKINILGKGAFGQVYLVENKLDGKRYAMKALDKMTVMQQNILRYAMTERKILSTINHPFVVKLHYAFQSDTKLYLVMDYCPGGDMLKLIKVKGTLEE